MYVCVCVYSFLLCMLFSLFPPWISGTKLQSTVVDATLHFLTLSSQAVLCFQKNAVEDFPGHFWLCKHIPIPNARARMCVCVCVCGVCVCVCVCVLCVCDRQTDRQTDRDRENSKSNLKLYFTRTVV